MLDDRMGVRQTAARDHGINILLVADIHVMVNLGLLVHAMNELQVQKPDFPRVHVQSSDASREPTREEDDFCCEPDCTDATGRRPARPRGRQGLVLHSGLVRDGSHH